MSQKYKSAFEDQTDEELEMDLLKGALTNPELYASVKGVFHNHPHPEQLDPTGRRIYEIFKKLETQSDG